MFVGTENNLLADATWVLTSTPPQTFVGSHDLIATSDWTPARVPGTAAEAMRSALGEVAAQSVDYDGRDWWWQATVKLGEFAVRRRLVIWGLATVGEVWIDGRLVASTDNMFRSYSVELDDLRGSVEIAMVARALPVGVLARRSRPRWKSDLVHAQELRFWRTSYLGRTIGWADRFPIVGPWRGIGLYSVRSHDVLRRSIRTRLDGDVGHLRIDVALAGDVTQVAAVVDGAVRGSLSRQENGDWLGEFRLPGVDLWWPHTHGEPRLYKVDLLVDGTATSLGHVGFRSVVANRQADGFALVMNGFPVFVRGVCWVPLDPISMRSTRQDLLAALTMLRDAGMNIVRVMGTMAYESDDFYDVCDQLGMLVWQDIMLGTLDPPDDDAFLANLKAEVGDLLDRLGGRPSLAAVSGGSETEQRPTLLGREPTSSTSKAQHETIPGVLKERGCLVPYVTSTPSGGALPTHVAQGIAHYFGVGAYLRPLTDIRTSNVRFAAECLAFSVPPERRSVDRHFGGSRVAGHHPAWKLGVPRDASTSWDFEDVRDHYVQLLLGVDAFELRRTDPDRYLDAGRAAVSIAMVEAFAQWRRPRSSCAGGIILAGRDLRPGAGWGVTDSDSLAKAPLYALRRVLAPLAVWIVDDGLDGVQVVVANDRADGFDVQLELQSWSEDGDLVDEATHTFWLAPYRVEEFAVDLLIGRFTDMSGSYGFGPRTRDVLRVALRDRGGSLLAEQVQLLDNRLRGLTRGGLEGSLVERVDGWHAVLTAHRTAQWVALASSAWTGEDGWFHMAPGTTRDVKLLPIEPRSGKGPNVSVRALNVEEFLLTP